MELKNACVNFDLAVQFFKKHARMLAAAKCPARGKYKGTRTTTLGIVYHGTSKANFRSIMEGNLRVPDGRTVRHATDSGYFGCGIYTTPDPKLAFAYARDGIVFACLALPGKRYRASYPRDMGRPKNPGYDSHLGYEGDGAPQLVFFDTDQLLPCYLVDRNNHHLAHAALQKAIQVIAEKTGNARPSEGMPRNYRGKPSSMAGVQGGLGSVAMAGSVVMAGSVAMAMLMAIKKKEKKKKKVESSKPTLLLVGRLALQRNVIK